MSSSTVNALWGIFNLAVGYLLVCRVGDFDLRDTADIVALGIGVVATALFAARHFGRLNGGTLPEQR